MLIVLNFSLLTNIFFQFMMFFIFILEVFSESEFKGSANKLVQKISNYQQAELKKIAGV